MQNEFFVDVKLIFFALLAFDELSPQAQCTVDDDSVFPLEIVFILKEQLNELGDLLLYASHVDQLHDS